MSVYVDDYNASFRGMIMCHMMADTHEELIAMARKIGVAEKWIQHEGQWSEHFDVCRSKKQLAIRHGAIEITAKELVQKFSPNRNRQTL